MLGWLKRKREEKRKIAEAHKLGEQMGERLGLAAKAFIEGRAEDVAGKLLEALRIRLSTVTNHPEGVSDTDIARIEYKIFLEHIEHFPEKLMQDAQIYLREPFEFAEVVGMLDEYKLQIVQQLRDIKVRLMLEGAELTGGKVLDLEETGGTSGRA